MKNRILSALAAAVLAACGGTNNSSTDPAQKAQSKATPSIKQAASNYQTAVEALYVAYFGRPADPNGLANFEAALQAAGAPSDVQSLAAAYSSNAAIKSLIDGFGTSKESQTLYGGGGTTAFVTAVFQNVLGRAPQTSGLGFWVNSIDSGQTSMGDAALAIMAGAFNNSSDQGKLDQQLINNRLGVAGLFTAQVLTDNAVADYSGSAAAARARTLLGQVDAATDVTAFQSMVMAAVATLAESPGIYLLAGGAATGGAASAIDATEGSTDGIGAAARFHYPLGLAADAAGNVYVTDNGNSTIRKITPDGTVTTLAGVVGSGVGDSDGTGASAYFGGPVGLALDAGGNLYVADEAASTIRKITPAGVVTTLAGTPYATGKTDGTGSAALFNNPTCLAADSQGNVFVVDHGNNTIRKITPAGVVTTFAGTPGLRGSNDGAGAEAGFSGPLGIAVDAADNLYVTDSGNAIVRKITPGGVVTTVAKSSNSFTLGYMIGIAVDTSGNIYVIDGANKVVDEITPSGTESVVAGVQNIADEGPDQLVLGALPGSLYFPNYLAIDGSGMLYVTTENVVVKIKLH